MSIGIVGGGMLGLTLGYLLTRAGVNVTVIEGRDRAGGLLDNFEVDGTWIDKYYHCILGGDTDLHALNAELGLTDQVKFASAKQGFFSDGKLYPMASGKDLLLFPPLTLLERFRLGLTILQAFRTNDVDRLEQTPVEEWLVGLGGRGAFEKVWRPLLKAKFDSNFDLTPATYIWSRLKRTSSTKAAAGAGDRLGYYVGSYRTLVNRLIERIEQAGSTVRLGARVQQVAIEDGQVTGLVVDGTRIAFDQVIVTTPLPALSAILPDAVRDQMTLPPAPEYLGVICGLLLLDRPLTPYYTLNIADSDIPFTGVIETTNVIDPADVGGNHLVYVPKYVTRNSPFNAKSDDELIGLYHEHLSRMLPSFREAKVRHAFVFRERLVEPLHQIGRPRPVTPMTTPVDGLFVVNNGQIYPELTNCQASVEHAKRALPTILEQRSARAAGRTPASVTA